MRTSGRFPARREIAAIVASEGVFSVAARPRLARTAQRMAAEGLLRLHAPGVYADPRPASELLGAAHAVRSRIVDGVLTGPAAARLTFWPEIPVAALTVSSRGHHRSRPGLVVTREQIPPELVMETGGVRVTRPALTALDLTLERGGDGIDRALRLRVARLGDMAEALRLTPGRRGNGTRRLLLRDSRDEPWSGAERASHRLLREARITGWRSNLPVRCGSTCYYLDVGFQAIKLGIEIDGFEVHRAENRAQFVHDRRKWTQLCNDGWALLHFAAVDVFDEPEQFVEEVRTAIDLRG